MLHPKVSGSLVAGALGTVLLAELSRHGVAITADEGGAIVLLITFALGYFIPSDDTPIAVPPSATLVATPPAARVPGPALYTETTTATSTPTQTTGGPAMETHIPLVGVAFLCAVLLGGCAAQPTSSTTPLPAPPPVTVEAPTSQNYPRTQLTRDAQFACRAQGLFNEAASIVSFIKPSATNLAILGSALVGDACTWVNSQ